MTALSMKTEQLEETRISLTQGAYHMVFSLRLSQQDGMTPPCEQHVSRFRQTSEEHKKEGDRECIIVSRSR